MRGRCGLLSLAVAAGALQLVESWPAEAQRAARAMIEKYGEPETATSDILVWRGNGPWARTVVVREAAEHNFPAPHRDVLQQTVHYRVPDERVDDVVRFDGSLVYDRTRGELTSACDSEATNILALNLANRVALGELSVEQARKRLAAGAGAAQLEFATTSQGAPDPDQALSIEKKPTEGSSERLQDEEPPTAEGPPR